MKNIIVNTPYRKWFSRHGVHGVGFAFLDGSLLREEMICDILLDAVQNNSLNTLLRKINGNFAFLIEREGQVYLIADKIRSYPLLYRKMGDGYFITDYASEIMGENSEIADDLVVAEFLSQGYLSGIKTLSSDIFIVEAGTWVQITMNQVVVHTYYSHIHSKFDLDEEEIMNRASASVENAFQRILRTVGTRQLVVPLSGGYDSRLIACLCKKFDVKNVICFTYGKIGSIEVRLSEQVARRIGFPWYFVEYTESLWRNVRASKSYQDYIEYGGNLNATPHIQDFPAVQRLLEQGIIHSDAVVIPGHSADLLGGSHLPQLSQKLTLDKLLYKRYYGLNYLRSKYARKLLQNLGNKVGRVSLTHDREECLNLYNDWGIKVRQANFIINSVRVYEFWGLEWRLPLWDDEFAGFWNSIPWVEKKESILYHRFLFEKYFNSAGVSFVKPVETLPFFAKQMKAIFSNSILMGCKRLYRIFENSYAMNSILSMSNYKKNKLLSKYMIYAPARINETLAVDYLLWFMKHCKSLEKEFN